MSLSSLEKIVEIGTKIKVSSKNEVLFLSHPENAPVVWLNEDNFVNVHVLVAMAFNLVMLNISAFCL